MVKRFALSEGRLVNLGNATGHPSFVMSASLQIKFWHKLNFGKTQRTMKQSLCFTKTFR